MHILLVNDDGINAPGIRALAKVLGLMAVLFIEHPAALRVHQDGA